VVAVQSLALAVLFGRYVCVGVGAAIVLVEFRTWAASVYLDYHTIPQVFVGALVGTVVGVIAYVGSQQVVC
jgi:hypothetical protein